MTHSRFNQPMVLSAVAVALTYAALVVLAAACAFGHADMFGRHAHHGSSEAAPHNALCAWACQATSEAVVSLPSPMTSSGLVGQPVAALSDPPATSFLPGLHSRAPPSGLIHSIG
jgi:hypothetical protein